MLRKLWADTAALLSPIGNLWYKKVILGVLAANAYPIGNLCYDKVILGVRAANV